MTELYYIRNKERGFLGNAPVWYAKNGHGYTAYIQGAERFYETKAIEMVNRDPDKWEAFKCSYVDKRLHLVFDYQDKERLGTDDPCGWDCGYYDQHRVIKNLLAKIEFAKYAIRNSISFMNTVDRTLRDVFDFKLEKIDNPNDRSLRGKIRHNYIRQLKSFQKNLSK